MKSRYQPRKLRTTRRRNPGRHSFKRQAACGYVMANGQATTARYSRRGRETDGKNGSQKNSTEQPLWNQVCTLYLMPEWPDFIEVTRRLAGSSVNFLDKTRTQA